MFLLRHLLSTYKEISGAQKNVTVCNKLQFFHARDLCLWTLRFQYENNPKYGNDTYEFFKYKMKPFISGFKNWFAKIEQSEQTQIFIKVFQSKIWAKQHILSWK